MKDRSQPAQGRLIHFTPLRYPGGKAKLAAYVKALMKDNGLLDGEYVEPYAGGAAIALELLFHEYVSRIHINDVSKLVHAFWKSVLNGTEAFCRLVMKTPLTVSQWDKQKKIIENPGDYDSVALGFATFFLNRTNPSGILNGGIIGGRDQTGPWKIDARYNARELIRRVEEIARSDQVDAAGCVEVPQVGGYQMAKGNTDLPRPSLLRERSRSVLRFLRTRRSCSYCRLHEDG